MINSLNGIRAFLFLLIFGAHFKYVIIYSDLGKSLFNFFNTARFAVLFFILLSGFCMALGYYNKFQTLSKQNYFDYIKRRFIKFYPLYLLSGLVGLFFIYLPQDSHYLNIFVLFYVTMLAPWFGIDAGGNPVGWFMSAIFFCYLATPPVLYLLNKKFSPKFHAGFCLINYLILIIFSFWLFLRHDVYNEFLYRFPVVRLFEYVIALDIGIVFAKLLKDNIKPKFLDNYFYKSLVDLVFVILFLVILYICPNNLLYRHLFEIPLVVLFLVYICIQKRSVLFDILNSNICNLLGNISFECFMIHILVFRLSSSYSAGKIFSIPDITVLYFTLLFVTILIAFIYKKAETVIKKRLIRC